MSEGTEVNTPIPSTIREQMAAAEKRYHERLAALERAKTFIPTAWLDMTDEQISEKYGINLYF